jgi:predicted glycogen debranching enzyme
MTNAPTFGREICGDLDQSLRREWLVTNGLGGFASGTIAGCQTRRYHGLLIAAEKPPVGRTMFLVDLDATARVDGRQYELACHEYEGGVVNPHGYQLVESFRLEGTVPTWVYALGSARVKKRVFMARERNTTYVTYSVERSLAPITLTVRPLCTGRDYHWQRRGGEGYRSETIGGGCRITAAETVSRLEITADGGEFVAAPDMHWNLRHRLEAARGLDSTEDLYMPGVFEFTLSQGDSVHFTATIETGAEPADVAFTSLLRHEATLLSQVSAVQPRWVRQLVLAADQYIVARVGTPNGKTVIAGYPWFGDWGRDTMIALPGLTLATGRTDLAADILRTFAKHIDQGLLPNRFPDSGDAPEYNTVDATLWYFVAIYEYLRATTDIAFAHEIYPVLEDIISWHRRGTRHGIRVDAADGLLRSGEPGVQLTWMDAKVDQWVVTPRAGKAVEINALWCNALWIMGQLAEQIGKAREARSYDDAAHATAQVFANRFWFDDGQYLYDVIDVPQPATIDASLRPNQLIALSLPYRLLDDVRARMVLRTCERELLTSYGLRTLDPDDPRYEGHYGGNQRQRDGAYHQGTVWPWLLGAFARAHFSLYGNVIWAASYLAPLEQHLSDACIGQISEIFDADAPHLPQGCVAQAWSVAEVLRAWLEIHAAASLPSVAAETPSLNRKVS